jgi:hypothetical protein
MTLKQFYITLLAFNGLIAPISGQKNGTWILPKHQLSAQFGSSKFEPYQAVDNAGDNIPSAGLAYTFNLSSHFYARFDAQIMRNAFVMGENIYVNNDFRRMVASVDSPLTLPLVRLTLTEDRQTLASEIKKAELIRLSSPNGFYQRNQYNLNMGYMKAAPRNILRIGLGVSFSRVQYRAMQTVILNPPDAAGNTFGAWIPHLVIKDIRNFDLNGLIGYEFFLTQKWSIGLQYNALFSKNRELRTSTTGITIGYAPYKSYFKRRKLEPRA